MTRGGKYQMSLSSDGEQLVMHIDAQVKYILSHNGDSTSILMSLSRHMIEIEDLMVSLSWDEANMYCQQYKGFWLFMACLEGLSLAIKMGEVSVPTYH